MVKGLIKIKGLVAVVTKIKITFVILLKKLLRITDLQVTKYPEELMFHPPQVILISPLSIKEIAFRVLVLTTMSSELGVLRYVMVDPNTYMIVDMKRSYNYRDPE